MSGLRTGRLITLTELDPAGRDIFTAPPSGGAGRMFGGEVAARALAAAQRSVPAERAVHVVQANYIRPGDPAEPLRLSVDRIRDGRAFSVRRVDVGQRGKVIFTATFSFHVGAGAFEHHDRMPAVPPPEELDDLDGWIGAPAVWPQWVSDDPALDLRPVPVQGVDPAGTRALWYRVCQPVPDDPALHA